MHYSQCITRYWEGNSETVTDLLHILRLVLITPR